MQLARIFNTSNLVEVGHFTTKQYDLLIILDYLKEASRVIFVKSVVVLNQINRLKKRDRFVLDVSQPSSMLEGVNCKTKLD